MQKYFLQMKYVLFILLAFIGFYACSDESNQLISDESETLYEKMGRLHNEGLDYVLGKITSTSPLTKYGGRKIPALIEIRQMCSDFARSKGYGVVTRSALVDRDTVQSFSFLSEQQQIWLRRVEKLVRTVTPDRIGKFTSAMTTLEKQLQQDDEISESEKQVLFYTMAVCRYSAHYWAENYEKWQVELYGVNKISTGKVRTRSENEYYVSKEWWETYKTIVWKDGASGIQSGDGYYLENATVGSVAECL